jgi:parallel beta-helix repeat protein
MTHNTIGPNNIIAHNGSSGILITGTDSFGNTITQNNIYDNWFGIRLLDGGNTMLDHPLIDGFEVAAGTVIGSGCANCIIEIFSTSGIEGDVYEGQTKANSMGTFTYDHGTSFTGPYLAATATDADGNTSELQHKIEWVQEGNNNPTIKLQTRQSNELEENKIGIFFGTLWDLQPEVFPNGELNANHILNQGVTWARFAIEDEYDKVHWDKPENTIEPSHDEFITTLAENGIRIMFHLSFWDKEYVAQGGDIHYPRFKAEDEILRYLDFVRFMVHHLKDRVEYFEIWNEPNLENTIQWIEVEDYINLVKRAVPVIRQEYPEAKIVVGGVTYIREQYAYDYLLSILKSDDIMPLVDVISWGGMFMTSPEYDFHKQYYYNIPSIVQEIKDTASAHGFEGEYVDNALNWSTPATPGYPETYCSERKCAKYYARGIIMHLGMDVMVSQFYAVPNEQPYLIVDTIRNLSTIMAGTESTELNFEIQSDATYIKSYAFSLPNGDNLIAVWDDGAAVDYNPGMSSTLVLPSYAGQKATGIDVLNGFEQELITSAENGNLVIHDLLVKDYPLILRLSE